MSLESLAVALSGNCPGQRPDADQFELGKAVGEHAGAAVRAGIAPDGPEALEVVKRLEAMSRA